MLSENDLIRSTEPVVVALGSNLPGDYASPVDLLEAALQALPKTGLQVVARSDWWRSLAWPNPADPPFINGVALVRTTLSASRTLAALHEVEAKFGRRRHIANAPRTLDLDLVAYGEVVSHSPALPHPRAHERAFVMRPLAQISPEWRHPILDITAAKLADSATIGVDAHLIDA